MYLIYMCGEMVNFCESDQMIKISGKVDKSNTYNGFSGYSDEVLLLIKNEILSLNPS